MEDNARPLPHVLAVGLMSLLAALALLVATPAFDTDAQAEATCSSGIMGNGTGGISINVNAAPYTTFAKYSYGENAYKTAGCAWFASARVNQLTGKGSTIWSGSSWYNSGYSSLGFTRGQTVQAPALACYENHVAVVEKVSGDTVYISEGGQTYYSDAAHGYTVIRTKTKAEVTSYDSFGGGKFLGFVYLGNVKWWTGETVQNLGNDFYANIILRSTWVSATVDPSTWRIVNRDTDLTGHTDNYEAAYWHFTRNSDGSYKIVNPHYDNRPLEASGTSSGDWMVLGSSYTGAAKQKWFVYHASGQYIVRNAASDFVINVDSAKSAAGTKWQIWNYTDSAAERLSIYKHTQPTANTLTVKAGTSSDATTFTWTKPESGTVGWYDLKVGKLDDSGNIQAPYYNKDDLAKSITSQEITLPAGKYRAWVRAYAYWGAYSTSNTVEFTVGSGDTEAPTISDVKVAEITDTQVKITAHVTDNVGVVNQMKVDSAIYSGLNIRDTTEVGEPGSGDMRNIAPLDLRRFTNLTDTPQKDFQLELMFYIAGDTYGKLGPGHHELTLWVRDTSRNASEPVTVEFDVPFAQTVTLAVGESKTLDEVFGGSSTVGTAPNIYDGGQGVLDITPSKPSEVTASKPYTFTGKKAGSCTIGFVNNSSGEMAVKRLVVTEEGGGDNDEAVQQVMAAIDAVNTLPAAENVTLGDKAAIEDARAKFDAVVNDDELADLMSAVSYRSTSTKLEAVEAALAKLEEEAAAQAEREAAEQAERAAVKAIIDAAKALPAASAVTLDDADAIYATQEGIDSLTDEQMEYVSTSEWIAATGKLQEALNALEALQEEAAAKAADQLAADNACALVNALPAAEAVTLEDEADVNEAKAAFEGLTDAQKAFIGTATYSTLQKKLADVEAKLAELAAGQGEDDVKAKDQAAADAARALVEALPAADAVTLEDADAVTAAKDAFYGLTKDQKNCFTATDYSDLKDKLDAAAAKVAALQEEAEKAAADKAAVDEVRTMIADLPEAANVKLGDADAINAAQAAYDALSAEQQDALGNSVWKKLNAATTQLTKLQKESEADQAAADNALSLVDALPDADKVKLSDEAAIGKAEAAFNGLTEAQADLVKPTAYRAALKKLNAVMAKLTDLKAAQGESGDDPAPGDDPKPSDDPKPQPAEKKAQKVTVAKTSVAKAYGDKAFSLGAKTNGDAELYYTTSNGNVATVSASGMVTIRGVGSANIVVVAPATDKFKKASATVKLTVSKGKNGFTAKAKKTTVTVKAAKVKKKAQAIKAATAFKVTNPIGGKVSYKKVSGNKKITVSNTGTITVKKGLKKGTYTVKVKATCTKANYASASKTIALKVKVK